MKNRYLVHILFLGWFSSCQYSDNDTISYNRDVRPIFNEKCLSCHGGVKQMGGFSLLFEADAFQVTKSGKPAIVRGNHQNSELYKRLVHKDLEQRMPNEGPALSSKEIDIIARWIDEGAKWEKHWAYRVLDSNIPLPSVKNTEWAQNDIDLFVLNKLEEKGLTPNPIADRPTLIRRLYLDLVGLPPTLEEAQQFFEDSGENALEKQVDNLLTSPHFGEHWAAMWLDLARYGDSQGYQKDNVRKHIWRYRDWVINAFNEDLPFDQFTIEQLAGDLLPNPTNDQILATAFHRNTNTNTEGGRGLLEETLVVWGGEFGRTPMQENREGITNPFFGRDHHGDAFTMWMCGGGVKPGFTYGATDELGYSSIGGAVHVHDLQATILHQLGIDHEQLTYRFQGRDFRLTDVHGHLVKEILT